MAVRNDTLCDAMSWRSQSFEVPLWRFGLLGAAVEVAVGASAPVTSESVGCR